MRNKFITAVVLFLVMVCLQTAYSSVQQGDSAKKKIDTAKARIINYDEWGLCEYFYSDMAFGKDIQIVPVHNFYINSFMTLFEIGIPFRKKRSLSLVFGLHNWDNNNFVRVGFQTGIEIKLFQYSRINFFGTFGVFPFVLVQEGSYFGLELEYMLTKKVFARFSPSYFSSFLRLLPEPHSNYLSSNFNVGSIIVLIKVGFMI